MGGSTARPFLVGGLLCISLLALTGCTGKGLAEAKQWVLIDLYMAAFGTKIHVQVGRKVAEDIKTIGQATASRIDFRIPGRQLEVDVWGKWDNPSGSFYRFWEIKPDPHFFNGRLADAAAQLQGYVDEATKKGLDVRQFFPGGVYYPQPGEVVPDRFTPDLAAKCIEIVLTTRVFANDEGNGIIGWRPRWKRGGQAENGKNCRDLDDKERTESIGQAIHEASGWVNQKKGNIVSSQAALIANAWKDGAELTLVALANPQIWDESRQQFLVDWGVDRWKVKGYLVKKPIPDYFFDAWPKPPAVPGVNFNSGPEKCLRTAC